MHQTKKDNQHFFGVKTYIRADVECGLVHHVHGTATNVADVAQVAELLHDEENAVYADAGYTGVEKPELIWQVAARRSNQAPVGYVKVRFRGLMKNTAQLTTLFALSNLWMARKQLMGMGELRA